MFKKIFMYFTSMEQTKLIKGLELAVLGAIATAIANAVNSNHIPTTWSEYQSILKGAAMVGGLYLLHNVPGVIAPFPVITETKNPQ